MKIALTADLHLADIKKFPERYHSFKNILDQCIQLEITQLIIAGDLFDKDQNDFSEFEKITNSQAYSGLSIHIIPGNHDVGLTPAKFSSKIVHVHSEVEWLNFESEWRFLLIPYMKNKTMGEVIQEKAKDAPGNWCLVGHGDWFTGNASLNPYEPGIYMPFTKRDLGLFKPDFVFLGHIHKRMMDSQVFYPGSPCPIDITETGYRYFFIFDTDQSVIHEQRVLTDLLYFDEELLVFPLENEEDMLREQIKRIINSWQVDPQDLTKVILRLTVKGYSGDRGRLKKIIRDAFGEVRFFKELDLSEVLFAYDPEKNFLLEKLILELESLELKNKADMPMKNQILGEALRLIFEE